MTKTCTSCEGRKWKFDMMLNQLKCPTCRGRGFIIAEEETRTTNEDVSYAEGREEE